MVKTNKYTPVIDGKPVYVYIRDNSKKGIFHYHINLDELPKPARGSTGTHILSDAKEFAYDLYKKLKANPASVPAVKTVSFKAVAERWLSHNTTKNDYNRHEYIVQTYLLPFFDQKIKLKDIGAINQIHINDYIVWRRKFWVREDDEATSTSGAKSKIAYDRMGKTVIATSSWQGEVSDSTLKRESGTLNQIIQSARDEGLISPTVVLKKPSFNITDDKRPCFTEDQADKLCRLAMERAQIDNPRRSRERRMLLNFIILLRHTGMRPGELSSVKWRDVDLAARIAYVAAANKGGKKTGSRAVPLFRQALAQLKIIHQDRIVELGGQSPGEDEHVFVSPDGIRIRCFINAFGGLLNECKFPPPPGKEGYSLYSFRHTIITTTGKDGMPPTLQTKTFGTSLEMINDRYDHNSAHEALKWMDELEASKSESKEQPSINASIVLDEKVGRRKLELGKSGLQLK